MNKVTYKILRQEEFTADDMGLDDALRSLGGCSDYGDKLGLGSWQYEFDVLVTNQENEEKQFTVVFQPEQRTDGIRNYAGWEVNAAGIHGCDADESDELERFCDYDDSVFLELESLAETAAKARLKELLSGLQE